MTFTPTIQGKVDPNNSSTSQLGIGASYTGTGTIVSAYQSITINISSNQSSALKGISIQFSQNNTNWSEFASYSLVVPSPPPSSDVFISQTFQIYGKYFRLTYLNGGVTTTTLKIQTILSVASNTVAINSNTIGGSLRYIQCDTNNSLNVNLSNPLSAFGEVSTVRPRPEAQVLFTYGSAGNPINTNTVINDTSGGSVSTTNGLCSISSGTSNGSFGQIRSKAGLSYRVGQGVLCIFSAIFQQGVANTIQTAGIGDGSTIDGYFFGYNGTSFGILHRNNSTQTWIPQTSWNIDVMDGSRGINNPSGQKIVPTNGNIYEIQYQYSGFGAILFKVEESTTGKFVAVHTIRYANSNTTTNLLNPILHLQWNATCTSGGVGVTLKTASGALFLEGIKRYLGPLYGFSNRSLNVTSTINVLGIRNNTTINSITNRATLILRDFSVAISGTSNANNVVGNCAILLNANVTGASYTNVDAINSIAATDIIGTTVTGGTILYAASMGNNTTVFQDFTNLAITINPGDTLTFTVNSNVSAAAQISVNWSEETS